MFHTPFSFFLLSQYLFFLDTLSLLLFSGTDKSRQELPSSFLSRPLFGKVSFRELGRTLFAQ